MFYLVLAILSSACISVIMRISKKYTENQLPLFAINYIICVVMSYIYMGSIPHVSGYGTSISLGIINGFFYLASFILLQKSVYQNGVILSSTFQKLGIVVPTLLTILVFHEALSMKQGIGLLIAFICILILQVGKDGVSMKSPILLLLLLLGSGCGDAMSKVFEQVGNANLSDMFLLFTFLFALILSLLYIVIKKERFNKMNILFGILIGVPNYFSARFLLKALYSLPAILVYPAYSVFTILAVGFAGVLFFKEKLQAKQGIALAGILVSLFLLN